jgi:hypothetical protein
MPRQWQLVGRPCEGNLVSNVGFLKRDVLKPALLEMQGNGEIALKEREKTTQDNKMCPLCLLHGKEEICYA